MAPEEAGIREGCRRGCQRCDFLHVALPFHTSGIRGQGGGRRDLLPFSDHLGLFPEGLSLGQLIEWHLKEFSYPLADSQGAEQVRLASAVGKLANNN